MHVHLYDGSPDDAALELQAPVYEGPFDDLEFPSTEAREEARSILSREHRCWLDSTTLAVEVSTETEHSDGGTCCECGGPHDCQDCPVFK